MTGYPEKAQSVNTVYPYRCLVGSNKRFESAVFTPEIQGIAYTAFTLVKTQNYRAVFIFYDTNRFIHKGTSEDYGYTLILTYFERYFNVFLKTLDKLRTR